MYPFIRLSESIFIPTYWLVISLVYSVAIYYCFAIAQKNNLNLKISSNLILIILLSGFLGARLTFIIWEQPLYYQLNPLDTLKVWQGGYTFYGGAIAAALTSYLYLKIEKQLFIRWANAWTPVFCLGYAFGRLGCFLTGCCYGKVCDLPWSVLSQGVARHPVQLYTIALELLIFTFIYLIPRYLPGLKHKIFYSWVFLHSINRIIMEEFRADDRGQNIMGLSFSTFLSLILICFSVVQLFRETKIQNESYSK